MSSTSRRTLLKALAIGAGSTLVAPAHALAQSSSESSSGSSVLQLFGPAGGRSVGSSESGLVVGNIGSNGRGRFLAGDVQVVTVTEDSATITWLTWEAESASDKAPKGLPTAGELRVWPVDNPSDTTVVKSPSDRFFHQLTVSGLRADTTYALSLIHI